MPVRRQWRWKRPGLIQEQFTAEQTKRLALKARLSPLMDGVTI